MQWSSWSEQEGELSARERRIVNIAFKISNNLSLAAAESVDQLTELPDEDVFAVIKMVALLTYWQELVDAHSGTPPAIDKDADAALGETAHEPQTFVPTPYFYEGNPPPPTRAKPRERYDSGDLSGNFRRNGSHH